MPITVITVNATNQNTIYNNYPTSKGWTVVTPSVTSVKGKVIGQVEKSDRFSFIGVCKIIAGIFLTTITLGIGYKKIPSIRELFENKQIVVFVSTQQQNKTKAPTKPKGRPKPPPKQPPKQHTPPSSSGSSVPPPTQPINQPPLHSSSASNSSSSAPTSSSQPTSTRSKYERKAVLQRFQTKHGHLYSQQQLTDLVNKADALAYSVYFDQTLGNQRDALEQKISARTGAKARAQELDAKIFALSLKTAHRFAQTKHANIYLDNFVWGKNGNKPAPEIELFGPHAAALKITGQVQATGVIYRNLMGSGGFNVANAVYVMARQEEDVLRALKDKHMTNAAHVNDWNSETEWHRKFFYDWHIPGILPLYDIYVVDIVSYDQQNKPQTFPMKGLLLPKAEGDLSHFMHAAHQTSSSKYTTIDLSDDKQQSIALQLATTLSALHANGIAHEDFKPGNVLYIKNKDGTYTTYLSDFGKTRLFGPKQQAVGDTNYLPWEALGVLDGPSQQPHLSGPARDNFGLGMTLFGLKHGASYAKFEEAYQYLAFQGLKLNVMEGYRFNRSEIEKIRANDFNNNLNDPLFLEIYKALNANPRTTKQVTNYVVTNYFRNEYLGIYQQYIAHLSSSPDIMDRLIAGLMHPDYSQRLTAQQVVQALSQQARSPQGGEGSSQGQGY